MRMRPAAVLAAVLVAVSGAAAALANPPFRPSAFVPRVDNPWFPLTPGTVYVYRGLEGGLPSREVVTVTRSSVVIAGVRATPVQDNVYVGGHLSERTTDWYAQDRAGNVWYLGEDTAELDAAGRVTSREGTWRAGADGATAGILMPARPVVGSGGRQEYLKGEAEDRYRVKALAARVATPAARSARALLTEEWSPLEPGVLERKFYVRGVGFVLSQTVAGGSDRTELVSVRRP
jgi:hypothetical protein